MAIRVLYDALFSDLAQCHEEAVALAHPTVEKLIQVLSQRHGQGFLDMVVNPATGVPKPEVIILVNGLNRAWDVTLDEGAEVAFLVPIAGGGY